MLAFRFGNSATFCVRLEPAFVCGLVRGKDGWVGHLDTAMRLPPGRKVSRPDKRPARHKSRASSLVTSDS